MVSGTAWHNMPRREAAAAGHGEVGNGWHTREAAETAHAQCWEGRQGTQGTGGLLGGWHLSTDTTEPPGRRAEVAEGTSVQSSCEQVGAEGPWEGRGPEAKGMASPGS